MKVLNFALLNIMLLGGLSLSTCNKANAAERPEAKKMKAITTEINEKVPFPDELSDQNINEKVIVEFKIKENKTIEVISVQTMNDYLNTYVKNHIENILLYSNDSFDGKTLQLTLYFKN